MQAPVCRDTGSKAGGVAHHPPWYPAPTCLDHFGSKNQPARQSRCRRLVNKRNAPRRCTNYYMGAAHQATQIAIVDDLPNEVLGRALQESPG